MAKTLEHSVANVASFRRKSTAACALRETRDARSLLWRSHRKEVVDHMTTAAQTGLKAAVDQILEHAVRPNGVAGVVAIATDRNGNIYERAAGKADLGTGAPMELDAIFALFSTTKAITGAVVMKLVEDGKIDLDAPAKTYAPSIANVKVLDGYDDAGAPKTRAPKTEITTRQLLSHTAGFGYDFFSTDLITYGEKAGVPSVVSSTNASLESVLLFDPGERWEYGSNIDWAGKVAEGATGKRLGELMHEYIFAPLGMNDTAFVMTPAMRAKRATIHQRGADGTLSPLSDFELPSEPEQHMGGHGLYGTVGDYMKFIRMILNDGAGPNGRVLSAATVAKMAKNQLGALKVTPLPGAIPSLTNDAEFFPGMPKSWGLTFMINDEDAPTGRPAGSLAWAGLANCYYWIDRQNGIGGYWATQLFPFADTVSLPGFFEFEKAVYDNR
jgi:methyl acetate hydrolase